MQEPYLSLFLWCQHLLLVKIEKYSKKKHFHHVYEKPGARYHNLRTRKVGNAIAVDVHVKMDGNITLNEAHDIATEIENRIKDKFGANSIINIHMEPFHK